MDALGGAPKRRQASKESEASKPRAPRDQKDQKQEDEIRMVEMENRARKMVVDLLTPSIMRLSRLSSMVEEIGMESKDTVEQVRRLTSEMDVVKERGELMLVFRERIEDFRRYCDVLEAKVNDAHSQTFSRVQACEDSCNSQKMNYVRIEKTADRTAQDLDVLENRLNKMVIAVDEGLQRAHDHTDQESKRVDVCIKELQEAHDRSVRDIWGESLSNISEESPLCLWRLDAQVRRLHTGLTEAQSDLGELSRLDVEVRRQAESQAELEKQQETAVETVLSLQSKAEKTLRECKQDNARVANMTAASTANLIKDTRERFSEEVAGALRIMEGLSGGADGILRDIQGLSREVDSTSRRLDQEFQEVRTDLDTMETRMRRDKQASDEAAHLLKDRMATSSDASEAATRGLDHLSQVVSMALQSERMAVALELQDFLDRKDTPYVGVRAIAPRKGTQVAAPSKPRGIHPDHLTALKYEPRPVSFQGQPFERPKLLALREQLLHVAQEVLQQDMVGSRLPRQRRKLAEGAADPRLPPAPPIVPEATGFAGELPREIVSSEEHSTARSSRTSSARRRPSRPGSRCQPAASGSTPLVDIGDLALVDVKLQAGMLRSGSNPATSEGEIAPDEAGDLARLPSLRSASGHAGRSATPDGWTSLPQPPATAR